ncbi:DUF3152 domain-containing protein [Pseudonocardiaceae bacterium YIM PH 21723]|nr:DUF3152 domain-containing protein [Pseudonocardiaceae bacterium YIM PH 21723]
MPHVPGERRTGAEPLAASWDPLADREGGTATATRIRPVKRSRKLAGAHGWRLYALPILLVLTVLAVLDATKDAPAGGFGPTTPGGKPTLADGAPGAKYAAGLSSAELPKGVPIPAEGSGTYRVVPGKSDLAGKGKQYTYTVEIEDGVKLTEGDDSFGNLVQETLSDTRSWIGSGTIALKRVDSGEVDFRVTLLSEKSAKQVCGQDIPYDTSCFVGPDRVYINGARWVRGAISFHGDMGNYRRYAINHEVGHFFEKPHVPCTANGALAPVMMQQTFSVSNNDLAQITERNPQQILIPKDGAVCRPNPFPYPVGDQAGQ